MAVRLFLLVLLFVFHCNCSPVKKATDTLVVDSCQGKECDNDLTTAEDVDVILPDNFTEIFMMNMMHLPSLVDGQTQMMTVLEDLRENQYLLRESQDYLNRSQGATKKSQDLLMSIVTNQSIVLEGMVHVLKGIQRKLDENFPDLMTTTNEPEITQDCADYVKYGYTESKPYVITPVIGGDSFSLYCDMNVDGGGWTVIQRRFDGSVDFYRSWQDYVDGFGDPFGEYWAGLDLIHTLTNTGTWELRIDLEDFNGHKAFASYTTFSVGDAASNYQLTLFGYRYDSTVGDAMQFNSNNQFSTKDADNNRYYSNCAQERQGAWWYDNCSYANLNGLYLGPNQSDINGMYWWFWKNNAEVLKRSEMKIRQRVE